MLALVFRHSSDGQRFATKRVGQQALQGFHLVPLAFLCCLDDTRLEPTHPRVAQRDGESRRNGLVRQREETIPSRGRKPLSLLQREMSQSWEQERDKTGR